ncbi:efflux RND transporter permease subunit [Pseudodesulfovibrio thermohalotolerans]|uniref:efflux RND transporter permease subunit n=1 Tax=Pseudodesulfovibrio thermohalotolerans TaxID=2880651 RepID=UPI002442455A|nr:efflux RND transporter permease subunit [Pseudodesulfovibrio thermohalotolerans]WFS62950.1 efflux RND transporter permease subunit [Pseudodesulfovibrio thermohalotolerans]
MSLAEYAIKKSTVTLVLTICFLLGGIFSFLNMPRLEDPAFTIKQALVVTNYPGATPGEVANEVTDVIESAAQQLSQLDKVSSQSNPGQSIVTVEVKDKYDSDSLPQVWDELRRKINDAQGSLPPGAGPSLVVDDFSDVYGILLAVSGEGYSTQDIQDFAKYLRKQLLLVDNVAKINLWGDQTENVYVEMSRARMSRMGVTLGAVTDTLAQRNLVVPAGNVRVGPEYVRISPTGVKPTVESLGELLIASADGTKLVALNEIADIFRGYSDTPSRIMRFNGEQAVAMGISMVPTGNVVELGRAIDKRLKELESMTPVGMRIDSIYYQPTRVDNAISAFVLNLAEAVAIVIVVLLLFMGLQSGLLIGVVLLITICGSFIFIQMAGVALERISLGALIIALGMLVDNAIVIVEGILIRYQGGQDRIQACVDVVEQNKWPLLGATIIAIMAFAGIGLSEESVGEFCNSLFVVLCISLFMSWVTAVTVTPLLCKLFLHPKPRAEKDPYGGLIFQIYKRFLESCIKHRLLTVNVLIGLLAVSIFGFGFVKQSFFPDSTQPRFFIHYWLPQGTDIRHTSEEITEIEALLHADARVKSVATFVGEGAPRFILTYTPEKTNTSYGLLLVEVEDYKQVDAVLAEYQAKVDDQFPDDEAKFKKFRLGPGRDAPIEVRFSGPDTKVLRELSFKAQGIMRSTGNARSIRDDWRQAVKVIRPVLSEAQAKRAGITRPALADTLKSFFDGHQIGVYRENDNLLPIILRPPAEERNHVHELGNVQVFSPTAGRMVPMEEVVAELRTEMDFGMIRSRNRMLTITASCEPITGLPSELFAQLKPHIEEMKLPTGYSMEWGGEYEDSTDAQKSLAKGIILPTIIMILMTVLLFNKIRNPLVIWLTVPLALIGVTASLLITGQPFGFMALLGFLSLSGMLIKNAVVLLDQIMLELMKGSEPYRAIVESAVSRIRPVAMASATTILGMIPLMFDPFFSSMAVTIMGGLMFATILTLILVPVLFATFHRIKKPGGPIVARQASSGEDHG